MEFTSVAYMVYNLPKAFLTSLSGMIVYNLFQQVNTVSEFTNNDTEIYNEGTLQTWKRSLMEIFLFAIIGLICGLFGVLFVYIVEVGNFCVCIQICDSCLISCLYVNYLKTSEYMDKYIHVYLL
jgi:H+/Cl- antiporter ClcA